MNIQQIPTIVWLPILVLLIALLFAFGRWLSRRPYRAMDRAIQWARSRGCEIKEVKGFEWSVRHPNENWTMSFNKTSINSGSRISGFYNWSKPLDVPSGDILLIFPVALESLESMFFDNALMNLGLNGATLKETKTRLTPMPTGDREFDHQWRVMGSHSGLASIVGPEMRTTLHTYLFKFKRGIQFAVYKGECKVFLLGNLLKPHELNDLDELGKRWSAMLSQIA